MSGQAVAHKLVCTRAADALKEKGGGPMMEQQVRVVENGLGIAEQRHAHGAILARQQRSAYSRT